MSEGLYIERDGRRTWLKWHRGRRRAGDPVFTRTRILEGMALGASVEVDLVVHADHGFAVLHDLTLDRETTGTGPVGAAAAETLRALHLRDDAGGPIEDRVLLLEDLAQLIVRDGAHPQALLQLDYKQDAAALASETIDNFTAALAPVARHFILSAGDADAVGLLSAGLPALRIGYDPCYGPSLEKLKSTRDFAGFVESALQAAPRAELIYLAWQIVLEADDAGFDLIGAFHEDGRRVDAWTLRGTGPEDRARAERLLRLGADQITTDDPEGLGRALG